MKKHYSRILSVPMQEGNVQTQLMMFSCNDTFPIIDTYYLVRTRIKLLNIFWGPWIVNPHQFWSKATAQVYAKTKLAVVAKRLNKTHTLVARFGKTLIAVMATAILINR